MYFSSKNIKDEKQEKDSLLRVSRLRFSSMLTFRTSDSPSLSLSLPLSLSLSIYIYMYKVFLIQRKKKEYVEEILTHNPFFIYFGGNFSEFLFELNDFLIRLLTFPSVADSLLSIFPSIAMIIYLILY